MRTFRRRLTLIMMSLVGISMLAAGVTMAQVYKDSHIRALKENMAREILLLESTFDFLPMDSAEASDYYTAKARELEDVTDSRVTFIMRDGTVVGDSEMTSAEMDNHAHREEIESSVRDKIGSAIRYSETIGEDMLYVAHGVTSANGNFDGFIRLSMSLAAVGQEMNKGWYYMGGGLMILFLVAAFVSFRVAAGLTRPLEKITRVANRISRLEYDARVDLYRRDEIGQLGAAINGMADSLQQQLKVIRDNEELMESVLANMTGGIIMIDSSGNIALLNRVAEKIMHVSSDQIQGKSYQVLKRNYELLKFVEEGITRQEFLREERTIYNPEERILQLDAVPMFEDDDSYKGLLVHLQDVTEIRRLERMRSEFVANVSHELKTPIAAVKGFAETLLAGGVADKETERSFLQIIHDEGERLNRLIGDILELSKIESKRAPLEYAPVHLKDLFDNIIEMLGSSAAKKNISLNHYIPEHLFMEGDEDRLRQIFVNLLSNAISYTQEGGKVRIDCEITGTPDEEKITITINDTGIGIPKKDLPRIFERFYRVDKARSRSSGGTGLGLSIVKHLVELHRGTIRVESKIGEGSSFILELPIMQHTSETGSI